MSIRGCNSVNSGNIAEIIDLNIFSNKFIREAIGLKYKHLTLASNEFSHKHCFNANLRAKIEDFIAWFEDVANLVDFIG